MSQKKKSQPGLGSCFVAGVPGRVLIHVDPCERHGVNLRQVLGESAAMFRKFGVFFVFFFSRFADRMNTIWL